MDNRAWRARVGAVAVSLAAVALATPRAGAQCWDGTIGRDGITGVRVLIAVEDDPFIAGPAMYATGYLGAGVMRWSGTVWEAIEDAPSGRHMAMYDGRLYVASNDDRAPDIMSWNGTVWEVAAEADGGRVRAMLVVGDWLYVAGEFEEIDGVTVNGIARFKDNSWSPLDGGLTKGARGRKQKAGSVSRFGLATDGSNLYVAGEFDGAGDQDARNVACWDGGQWSSRGDGIDAGGPIAVVNGAPYVAVSERRRGNWNWHVVGWLENTWSQVGDTVPGIARDVASFDDGDSLYVGGLFEFDTGGGLASNLVELEPMSETYWPVGWPGCDMCCSAIVWALAVLDEGDGPGLYPGGYHMWTDEIGRVRGVARWNRD